MLTFQKPLLQKLDARRRELGLSLAQLAQASGTSLPTVNRILSGTHPQASWSNVLAIARVLGLNVEFKPAADVAILREIQAARRADEIARTAQTDATLAGKPMDEQQLDHMRRQILHELLAGPNRNLWAK